MQKASRTLSYVPAYGDMHRPHHGHDHARAHVAAERAEPRLERLEPPLEARGRRLERDRVPFTAGLKRQLTDSLRKLAQDLQRLRPRG